MNEGPQVPTHTSWPHSPTPRSDGLRSCLLGRPLSPVKTTHLFASITFMLGGLLPKPLRLFIHSTIVEDLLPAGI